MRAPEDPRISALQGGEYVKKSSCNKAMDFVWPALSQSHIEGPGWGPYPWRRWHWGCGAVNQLARQ